jgi:hypothetical protein
VSLAIDAKEDVGKRPFQALLMKTLSSLIRVGEARPFDQVNLLSLMGKFDEAKGIDGIVEQGSLSNGEIGIVPVSRFTGQVEITGHNPWDVVSGSVESKILEEASFISMVAGSVNVGETEGATVAKEGEIEGEGVPRREGVGKVKQVSVPSSNNATRGTI